MSRQSARLARLIGWFRDIKTLPKLLLGFGGIGALMPVTGVIGWTGMQSLCAALDATFTGSAVLSAKVETLISNAGLYHRAVVRVPYLASADAAVGILKDGFSETQTKEQRS